MSDSIPFEYELMKQEDVEKHIKECEGHHVQQAVYSTFMHALTQICFTCQKIRGSICWYGNKSWRGQGEKSYEKNYSFYYLSFSWRIIDGKK